MNFSICTYNCCSLNKNIDVVRELANERYDLIFLQETLVTEDRMGELQFIDENYEVVGVCSVFSDKALETNAGRSEGGLACLWRKDSLFRVVKITIEKDFIILSLEIDSLIIVLVNVYIRSDIWETQTLNNYLESLCQLGNIISSTKFDSIFFMGDFNADPFSGRAWNNLSVFKNHNNLKCFDFDALDKDTFTFMSYGGAYTKWLDHIVGRDCDDVTVKNIKVIYEKYGSDHFPLSMQISINRTASLKQNIDRDNESKNNRLFVNWEKLNAEEIAMIENMVIGELSRFDECEFLYCTRLGCQDDLHRQQISNMYHSMSTSVIRGSSEFSRELTRVNKFRIVPGWNRNVKSLHAEARLKYLEWLNIGRPRNGLEFDLMKESRTLFKNALKECRLNEKKERSISIKEKFLSKSMRAFWSDVQRANNKIKISEIIDGKTKASEIVDIFTEKFLNFQDADKSLEEQEFLRLLKREWMLKNKFHLKISHVTLRRLIEKLNIGEGHDGIHTLFLRKASDNFLYFLSKFMIACYSHCFFPHILLKGDINPTIKDSKGNSTQSSNYRPVMQSSCLLKLFELHILEVLSDKLHFSSRQFGFKSQTSTTDACLVLKETVNRYMNKGGKAYSLFVDLSKAFDNVDHFILGKILIQRNIPPDIVLLIMYYLRNQEARIVWSDRKGRYCTIEKGVRQGGILSPLLFKLYVDDVLREITESGVGCRLGILRVNVLAYADDIVLLADTHDHLNTLYNLLKTKLTDKHLLINQGKSKCMIFKKSGSKETINDILLGNHTFEVVDKYKYLGHIIQDSLSDTADAEHRICNFYAKFHWVLRNFKNTSVEVLLFLFDSYCAPDYGLPLWFLSAIIHKQIFRTFEVAYNGSFKKMLGVPVTTSSHAVADACKVLLFIHYLVFIQVRYFKRIMNSNNEVLRILSFQIKEGYIFRSLIDKFFNMYGCNFTDNSLSIVKSRIYWVQRHEPRTGRALDLTMGL